MDSLDTNSGAGSGQARPRSRSRQRHLEREPQRSRKQARDGYTKAGQKICDAFNSPGGCSRQGCTDCHICKSCKQRGHGEHNCRNRSRVRLVPAPPRPLWLAGVEAMAARAAARGTRAIVSVDILWGITSRTRTTGLHSMTHMSSAWRTILLVTLHLQYVAGSIVSCTSSRDPLIGQMDLQPTSGQWASRLSTVTLSMWTATTRISPTTQLGAGSRPSYNPATSTLSLRDLRADPSLHHVAMDLDLRFSEIVIIFTDTPNPVHLDAASSPTTSSRLGSTVCLPSGQPKHAILWSPSAMLWRGAAHPLGRRGQHVSV